MSARAIVSGSVFGPVERKIAKNGKEYVLVTIREGGGDAVHWWRCFGFAEPPIEEFGRLAHGDPIAVAGEIDVAIWTPENRGARLSLTIVADAVISARKPKKPAARADEIERVDG